METADTLAQGHGELSSLQLSGIGTVTMRPLTMSDLPAMLSLLGRCSASGHEATVEIIIASLDWRPASASTLTLGAIDEDSDRLAGLAGLTADGRSDGSARFGLLVDPSCRRRGLGSALLEALVRAARGAGYRTLRGPASNDEAATRALARQGGFALRRLDLDQPPDLGRFILERSLTPLRSAAAAGGS